MNVDTPEDGERPFSQGDQQDDAPQVHMVCLQQGDKLGIAVYREASQEVYLY